MIKTVFSKISDGPCGMGAEDGLHREIAHTHRRKLMEQFNLCATRLLTPAQQDGMDFHIVSEECLLHPERPKADALITTQRNTAVGILTADCLPLLLADDENNIAAAVHLRRDSLVRGFAEKVIAGMRELGAENIEAFLGPCLQKESHFIDLATGRAMMKANPSIRRFMDKEGAQEKGFLFDYSGYAVSTLKRAKVRIAVCSKIDTFQDTDYFSRRRRRLDNNQGLALSAICLQ